MKNGALFSSKSGYKDIFGLFQNRGMKQKVEILISNQRERVTIEDFSLASLNKVCRFSPGTKLVQESLINVFISQAPRTSSPPSLKTYLPTVATLDRLDHVFTNLALHITPFKTGSDVHIYYNQLNCFIEFEAL